jgi:hypothetical protein
VPTKRSAIAFACGARTGVYTRQSVGEHVEFVAAPAGSVGDILPGVTSRHQSWRPPIWSARQAM